jgi:transcriptional regulator with XRE-family HTH domain
MDIPAWPYCGVALRAAKPRREYPVELQTIGDHIRKKRLDEDLTQAQLGELLEVSESTVNNWEKGRSTPDLRTLPRVVAWLGYNPEPEGGTLGVRVARRLREVGLSQEELATQLGADQSSVQGWEAGETQPSERYILALEGFCSNERS